MLYKDLLVIRNNMPDSLAKLKAKVQFAKLSRYVESELEPYFEVLSGIVEEHDVDRNKPQSQWPEEALEALNELLNERAEGEPPEVEISDLSDEDDISISFLAFLDEKDVVDL